MSIAGSATGAGSITETAPAQSRRLAAGPVFAILCLEHAP
jgi:hypothetical protein